MKGLLLKDWYLLTRYARSLLLISIVFLCLIPFAGDNMFIHIYPCMLLGMFPATLYSYDEREKWTVYSQALPVSREQYVTAKYAFGALLLAAFLAILSVLMLLFRTEDFETVIAVACTLGLLIPSLMMPLLLRLGAERGRIAYLVFIGALFGGSVLGMGALLKCEEMFSIPLPAWIVCAVMAAVYVISWRVAIILYRKREL